MGHSHGFVLCSILAGELCPPIIPFRFSVFEESVSENDRKSGALNCHGNIQSGTESANVIWQQAELISEVYWSTLHSYLEKLGKSSGNELRMSLTLISSHSGLTFHQVLCIIDKNECVALTPV